MQDLQPTLARAIRTLRIFDPKRVTAAKLRQVWDYRADGLNLQKAQEMLQKENDRRGAIRHNRGKNQVGDVLAQNSGKYVNALKNGKFLLRDHFLALELSIMPEDEAKKFPAYIRIIPLCDVPGKTSAAYPYKRPYFRIGDIIGKVDFNDDQDWEYYSKSWYRSGGQPKTTISNKCVQFIYPEIIYNADGGRIYVSLKISQQPVERFAGNWFFDAIAREFGAHKVEKNLRKIQLHHCFALRMERKLAGLEIYSRRVGGEIYDYCVLAGKETFHAPTIQEAISGLREKRNSRARFDAEILTADFQNGKCRVAGITFCSAGVRNFLADNGIEEGITMTRAQLREVVIKNRKINCDKYSDDLVKIGIRLTCK